jgi:hypothetical protein
MRSDEESSGALTLSTRPIAADYLGDVLSRSIKANRLDRPFAAAHAA